MNFHTGEKPYTCKYCPSKFCNPGNMRMHEKTVHEGHKRLYKRPNKKPKLETENEVPKTMQL